MNDLVKIIINDDGDKVDNPKWHLIVDHADAERTLCSGEVFGMGESKAVFKTKRANKGITCSQCIEMIKFFKSVKL